MRAFTAFLLGLLVIPVGALCALDLGLFPIHAVARPPGWEKRIAEMGFDKSVDKEAKGLTSSIAGSEEDLVRGVKIYREDCAGCHGDRGKPSAWGRHNLYPPAPDLSRHALDDEVPNLFAITKFGVRYTGMGGQKGMLSDDDIWRVATFLHEQDKLPPRADSMWKAGPPEGQPAAMNADAEPERR